MQGDHLSAKQILTVRDALGNGDAVQPTIANDFACSPVTTVVAILLDLEPVHVSDA